MLTVPPEGYQGAVQTPDDSDGFTTISRAVDLAEPGATIRVRPGVYRESLTFSRDVTVVADEGPGTVEIDAALLVSSATVRLLDLTLSGEDFEFARIQVSGGALQLDGCELRVRSVTAVHVRGGTVRIRGGSVSNDEGAGIVIESGFAEVVDCVLRDIAGPAVAVSGDAAPVFRGCTIADVAGTGALLSGTSRARFDECRLDRVEGPALLIQQSARPHFHDVVVQGAQAGQVSLYVTEQATPILTNCRLLGSGRHGAIIMDTAAPVLTHCTVEDSIGNGIRLLDHSRATFVHCRVLRTGAAGVVVADHAAPKFIDGEIRDCADVGALLIGQSAATFQRTKFHLNPVDVSTEGLAERLLPNG